jgi:hypothetical protein
MEGMKKKELKQVTPLKRKSAKCKKAEQVLEFMMQRVKDDIHGLAYGLSIFEMVPVKEKTDLASDGKHLFYQPEYVLSAYNMGNKDDLKQELIHLTLHGLLGHYELDEQYSRRTIIWDVMDRQVGKLNEMLGGARLGDILEEERDDLDDYDLALYFKACKLPSVANRLRKDRVIYKLDNHYLWHCGVMVAELSQEEGDGKGKEGRDKASERGDWKTARRLLTGEEQQNLSQMVKSLRQQGGHQIRYGDEFGTGMMNVQQAKVEGNSYQEVLREFFASREQVKEQIDSIDPMLYHYGMELYGDVPIIEPVEVSDMPSLHAIVIAVDTSGSCSGCVAERFLKETNNLLKDIRFMGGAEKLYLIQCDAVIQQEDVYEGDVELEQFSDFEEKMWMGWGGTSFIPVFKRIRELQNQGETIDCLIYLSDGEGSFPKQPPDCPTFFVMPEECCPQDDDTQGGYSWIPDWVNVVKLEGRIY